MKIVKVVAAIIEKDGKILIAKRLKGEFEGLWEFPGGKVEPGETPEEALVREIREEMEVKITVNEFLTDVEHDYSNFHLSMNCYICSLDNDNIHLNDHSAIKWIHPIDDIVGWVPADVKVIEAYKQKKGLNV